MSWNDLDKQTIISFVRDPPPPAQFVGYSLAGVLTKSVYGLKFSLIEPSNSRYHHSYREKLLGAQ